MAVPAYQSMTAVTTGTTTVAGTLPASLATGDGVLMVVVCKPDTATIVTPAGWSLVANVAGGGGSTGNGTGPSQQAWFFREKDASWSTMPTVTVTNGTRAASASFRYTKTAGTIWDVAAATGVWGTGATTTNMSTTLGSNPGLIPNDAVIGMFTNQASTLSATAEAWTATGVSVWGTVTERSESIVNATNPSVSSVVYTGSVTTGTATAAPVMAGTIATAGRGTSATIRLREVTLTPISGTESVAVTISESSSIAVTSQVSASDTAALTISETSSITQLNPIVQVQSIGTENVGGSTTSSAAFVSPATAGNIIVAMLAGDKNVGPSSFAGTGWNLVHENYSTSVSICVAWKVAAGGETTITSNHASDGSGSTVWIGEYSQAGSGAWEIKGSGFHDTDESNVLTWNSGTTSPTTDDGAGLAFLAMDSGHSGTHTWDSGYNTIQTFTSNAGAAVASVGENLAVPTGTSATSTWTTTGTADQASAAIMVFGRSTATATPITGVESTAISIADSSSVLVQISANDTCAITISDSSSSQSTLSRTDTAAITIAETSAVAGTVTASDTTAISIADSSSVSIQTAVSASDTAAITITEGTSQVAVTQPASDTAAITIAESRSLAGSSTSTDTAAITITESSQVVITQFVSASDTAAITISESSAPTVVLSASDTAAITIADVSIPSVTAPGSESVAVTITENSSVFVSLSASDTCAITIADSSAPTVQFSSTDTVAITIDDQAGFTAKNISASDTAAITINDQAALAQTQFVTANDTTAVAIAETSGIFYALSASDTCAISIADSSSVSVSGSQNVAASDTAAVTIAETSNIVITQNQTGTESVAVSIAETSSVGGTTAASDTTAVTISETSSVFATVTASDNAAITITESSSASQKTDIPGTDTVAIAISEASDIQVSGVFAVSASDTAAITISESTQVAQTVQVVASDAVAISVVETSSSAGTMTSSDTAAIQIADTSVMVKSLGASDSTAITIIESVDITAIDALFQLSADDTISISISEHINIVNPFDTTVVIRVGSHIVSKNNLASEIVNGTMASETSTQTGHSGGKAEQQARID